MQDVDGRGTFQISGMSINLANVGPRKVERGWGVLIDAQAPELAMTEGDGGPPASRRGKHNVKSLEISPKGASSGDRPEDARRTASIYPGLDSEFPSDLADILSKLEKSVGLPIWLLIQRDHEGPFGHIDDLISRAFMSQRKELQSCNHVALVLDSPGGYASSAYKIATMLRRHCSGFTAIVPRYAKSAATLLALGAREIYMGSDAELGPLDAQVSDPEREEFIGALDETQALERLNAAALGLLDETMTLLLMRTHKKVESLLPQVTHFTAEMMRPLLEKIDAVHYSQYARVLKVAEEYAVRLMSPVYGDKRAEQVARFLVNEYSEHGFVINRDEASQLLVIGDCDEERQSIIDELEEWLTLNKIQAVGRLVTPRDPGEVNEQ